MERIRSAARGSLVNQVMTGMPCLAHASSMRLVTWERFLSRRDGGTPYNCGYNFGTKTVRSFRLSRWPDDLGTEADAKHHFAAPSTPSSETELRLRLIRFRNTLRRSRQTRAYSCMCSRMDVTRLTINFGPKHTQ